MSICPFANQTMRWDGTWPMSYTSGPWRGLLHTTEGTGVPAYADEKGRKGAKAPHFTLLPDVARQSVVVYQHFDTNRPSRALSNTTAPGETNREQVVQIELVGTCGWVYTIAPNSKALLWPEAPEWALAGVRRLMRWIEDAHGITLSLTGDYGRADLRLHLLGRFNVSNAMAVASCWLALGVPLESVVDLLEQLEPVAGRMQRIESPDAPMVVVDYAHSPDALANTLEALRPVALARGGALWCVFGAGGDRDPGKRPMMGYIAQRGADHVVVTSDNPRSEAPFRIVSDIRAGLSREPFATELDRERAIDLAIAQAGSADVVLIAGKGHEDYQEIKGTRHPFSDVQVARRAQARRLADKAANGPPGGATDV